MRLVRCAGIFARKTHPRDCRGHGKRSGGPFSRGRRENFAPTLRHERLDREIFFSLAQARVVVAAWRVPCETARRHPSPGTDHPHRWSLFARIVAGNPYRSRHPPRRKDSPCIGTETGPPHRGRPVNRPPARSPEQFDQRSGGLHHRLTDPEGRIDGGSRVSPVQGKVVFVHVRVTFAALWPLMILGGSATNRRQGSGAEIERPWKGTQCRPCLLRDPGSGAGPRRGLRSGAAERAARLQDCEP